MSDERDYEAWKAEYRRAMDKEVREHWIRMEALIRELSKTANGRAVEKP